MTTLERFKTKRRNIIARMQEIADRDGVTENFGEKEYREFADEINAQDDISYADKATECALLAEVLKDITPQR